MKTLLSKFTLIALLGLFSVLLTSCEKDDDVNTILPADDAYTTLEVNAAGAQNNVVTISGIIGKKIQATTVLPKVVISKLDDKGAKVPMYTYTNLDLNSATNGMNTKLVGPYGKESNVVYSFSTAIPLADLGHGVKETKATTITFEIYDATKVIAVYEVRTADHNIKLL
jgi:hypothetical protein